MVKFILLADCLVGIKHSEWSARQTSRGIEPVKDFKKTRRDAGALAEDQVHDQLSELGLDTTIKSWKCGITCHTRDHNVLMKLGKSVEDNFQKAYRRTLLIPSRANLHFDTSWRDSQEAIVIRAT